MTSQPPVQIIGEALVDAVVRCGGVDESPGGSPANVALALGRLGWRPQLFTVLGDDERGALVRAWLEASDVSVCSTPAEHTSSAVAHLDAAGAASYEFDVQWAPGTLTLKPSGYVHTGSIAAVLEPGATTVAVALSAARAGALVTYDPNARPSLMGEAANVRPIVEQFVGLSDVVKASDEDLHWLYPDREPIAVARSWLAMGPAIVVVTGGEHGATGLARSGSTAVVARSTAVVDTVGAGDTFMGALIDGLLREGYCGATDRDRLRDVDADTLTELLEFASRAAAVTVSRKGADPPWRDELDA